MVVFPLSHNLEKSHLSMSGFTFTKSKTLCTRDRTVLLEGREFSSNYYYINGIIKTSWKIQLASVINLIKNTANISPPISSSSYPHCFVCLYTWSMVCLHHVNRSDAHTGNFLSFFAYRIVPVAKSYNLLKMTYIYCIIILYLPWYIALRRLRHCIP